MIFTWKSFPSAGVDLKALRTLRTRADCNDFHLKVLLHSWGRPGSIENEDKLQWFSPASPPPQLGYTWKQLEQGAPEGLTLVKETMVVPPSGSVQSVSVMVTMDVVSSYSLTTGFTLLKTGCNETLVGTGYNKSLVWTGYNETLVRTGYNVTNMDWLQRDFSEDWLQYVISEVWL